MEKRLLRGLKRKRTPTPTSHTAYEPTEDEYTERCESNETEI